MLSWTRLSDSWTFPSGDPAASAFWAAHGLLSLDVFKAELFIFPSNLPLPTVPILVLSLQTPLTHIRNKGASLTLPSPYTPGTIKS